MKTINLRFHTPLRKNAIVLLVLILMLAFFASTPLQGSAADMGKGYQVLNKAPIPVLIFMKYVNGENANAKPGLYLTQGSPITWTYYIVNVGSASLSNIQITDDNGTPDYPDDDFTVCTIDKLTNNQSDACTHTGTADLGPHGNIATVNAYPPTGPVITDQDPAYYFGYTTGPSITILKYTNGEDADQAPGPEIPVGEAVTWTYQVYNTGDVELTDLVVMDDNGTQGDTSDDFQVCTRTSLASLADFECTSDGTALLGQYKNIGSASGYHNTTQVTDQDQSHYNGLSIDLEKSTNGQDADSAPGPYIPVGDTVTWTYTVTNISNVTLSDVTVTDDQGLSVSCPQTGLTAGEQMTCSASGTAAAGLYANLGTVTADPPAGLDQVSDSDPSHYFGALVSVDLEKSTNGQDADSAPGPYIPVGDPLAWDYSITNTGNLTLFNLVVSDDNGTPGDPSDDLPVCTLASLVPDAADSCSASGTAVAGGYANLGTVTADPTAGLDQVSDSDPSHYFGALVAIDLEKSTNGQDADSSPGPYIPVGESVTWTYTVTNTGNVELTDVTVTDDQGVTVWCPPNSLPAGGQMTCTASGLVASGQYTNVGTATGTPPGELADVSDTDLSHYFGVSDPQPALALQKYTFGLDADTAPGPSVSVGVPVTWTYTVTNTGNLTLFGVMVTDDNGTPGDNSDDVTVCTIDSLDPDTSDTCSASGTASAGQYTNVSTVSGTYPGGLSDVTDSDPSNYFGVSDPNQPALDLQKFTFGLDADTTPGPSVPVGVSVSWTYSFTNTSNLTLFDVTVTDDNGTAGDPSDDVTVCTITYLDPDESDSCSDSGTAVAGQYTNVGTVMGTYPGGLSEVSDTDTSNYFGVNDPQPTLAIQKYTNGLDADTAPGPYVPVGDTVTWTYSFTNTGNLTLFDISVTDDNGTSGDDVTVCTIDFLEPDASDTCFANGTASEGQYTNVGRVSGTYPGGFSDVSASDTSNYFGMQAGVDLEKSTNGQDADTAPGPSIPVGESVTWTYTVTNTGNVALSNVSVTDDQGLNVSCPKYRLAVGEQMTCSASYTAALGQYTNIGSVSSTPPDGLTDVSDTDPSNYFGVSDPPQTALDLQKYTNGLDADTAPGPYVPVGETVTWTYTVTNTGNLTLSDIMVTDDNGTTSDPSDDVTVCTIASLNPDTSDTCSASGTASAGQYANLGTAASTPTGDLPDVSDTDISHYFGAQPSINIEKLTNGQDADTAPGPSILVGDSVTWEFIISNNGNVPLSDIEVVDDQLGSICTKESLDVGTSTTCEATGTAVLGQYKNVATVTATPPGDLTDIQGEDNSHYLGYSPGPEIELQKSTNGFDADSAPGPTLIVGYNVSWDFTISNLGDETITNITIIDDNGTPVDKSDDLTVCSLKSLAPHDSHTCTIHGKVLEGQYANVGTVTGYLNEKMVSAADPSHYFGKFPVLTLPLIFRNGIYP